MAACRDLELMRVTMMEKVEVPFRAKCDLLARVGALACNTEVLTLEGRERGRVSLIR